MQNGCTLQCSRFDRSIFQRLGKDSVPTAVSAATTTVAAASAGATTAATAVATTATGATTATTAVAAATTGAACATAATESAATTTVAATTTTTGTTTAAPEAARTLFAWTGFIDDQGTTVHLLAVHAIDGRQGFGVGAHFHESKTLGAAGFPVHHDLRRRHRAELSECLLEIVVSYVVRQVTDVEFVAHCERLSLQKTQNNCVASTYPDPFKQRRCYSTQNFHYG